jgi:Uma2 family endonuclease
MREEVRAMVSEDKLMTIDEFWAKYADQKFVELVRGKVVFGEPSGMLVSVINAEICFEIGKFAREQKLGVVTGATCGYQLGADTLREVDMGFVSKEKWRQIVDKDKYVPFAPDLAVEVVAPKDSASELQDKIGLYLAGGTRLLWVFFPERREVVVHHPDRTARTLNAEETLDGEDVLPGLKLNVGVLFAPIDKFK